MKLQHLFMKQIFPMLARIAKSCHGHNLSSEVRPIITDGVVSIEYEGVMNAYDTNAYDTRSKKVL